MFFSLYSYDELVIIITGAEWTINYCRISINVTCIKTDVFHLLFKDISVAHADEEKRTIAESRQGKIQRHQHTQP